ncbi:MAG TPA: hypothetical protein VFT62_06980 [Mycobacteriales bacterium]|nr:hypothetical protein [Mycobacteriales bacterium]
MDQSAHERYEHNRHEAKRLSRATGVYTGLAVASGVVASLAGGPWRWLLVGLATLLGAITAWMLLFVGFIVWIIRNTRPN